MQTDKKIIMPLGGHKQLTLEFGVSFPTVRAALNGITKSALAERIRTRALECGGEIYQKVEPYRNIPG